MSKFTFTASFDTAEELVQFLTGKGVQSIPAAEKPIKKTETKPEAPAKNETKAQVAAEPSTAPALAPAASTPAASPAPWEASDESPSVDYPTLQTAVFKAAKLNKDATLKIAKDLGADTFKALAPEQWGPALKLVNDLIASFEVA